MRDLDWANLAARLNGSASLDEFKSGIFVQNRKRDIRLVEFLPKWMDYVRRCFVELLEDLPRVVTRYISDFEVDNANIGDNVHTPPPRNLSYVQRREWNLKQGVAIAASL